MFKAVLFDKACWTQHLKLDTVTGLDPEGIKLRAAQGMSLLSVFADVDQHNHKEMFRS